MYANNDAQQWWYFLVSAIAIVSALGTFVLVMIRSLYHWRTDNHWLRCRLWYWRLAFLVFALIQLCLPTFRSWWIAREDDWRLWWQWWCYLRSVATVFFNIGAFLFAIWSLLCLNEELTDCLWFALAAIFMSGCVFLWLLTCLVLIYFTLTGEAAARSSF